jgi:signal transduction histidine kinase
MWALQAPACARGHVKVMCLVTTAPPCAYCGVDTQRSSYAGDIVGYRAFVAIVAAGYLILIALTPTAWGPSHIRERGVLSIIYLAMGVWGYRYARNIGSLPVSLAYLLIEFTIGMRINSLVRDGLVPLILLPLAAQAVLLLPRLWATLFCTLVIGGVSGNLTWIPTWPYWFRNLATATAAVVFVVVYVALAAREREARERVEKLSAEVAQLAAANERNRLAREIHDTLGHYLTVIHVQLEAARAVMQADPERGLLAVNRAQALAKDGLTAVRQSVKALRENSRVEGIEEQLASLVSAVRDESFRAKFTLQGAPRSVSAGVALALHRTALEALTNVRRHAAATEVEIMLAFKPEGRIRLSVRDDGRGTDVLDGGFGLTGIRERAEQLGGTVAFETSPGAGFVLGMELQG